MLNFFITFTLGTATGVALEKFVFARMREEGIKSRTDALRICFGEPMFATTFTFAEVKEWIKARKDQLVDDTAIAVVKIDESTMKSLGKDLDTRGIENYLVLVVLTKDKQITESLLVKYERLDQDLDNTLAKGNGVLVVNE